MNRTANSHLLILFCILCVSMLFGSSVVLGQDRGFQKKKNSSGRSDFPFIGYAEKYALIVGINEYSDRKIPDLRYAVSDAESIRDILIETYEYPEENVTMLLNGEATGGGIKAAFERYIQGNVSENSQLLVYFAGHGTTIGGQGSGELGYLLPTDADVGSVYSTGLAMNDIQNMARTARPKHVLFLMDACYGGLAQTRSLTSSVFVQNALGRKARQLITAGSAEEEVVESAEWQHSAFTKVLINGLEEGLADSNRDDIISSTELFVYIQNRVPYWAQSQGGEQTPQFSRLTPDDGTFLFIKDDAALSNLVGGDEAKLGLDEEVIARNFKSTIQVRSNVDNARVYVDDKEVGWLSQGGFDHAISPGFYRIELAKEKYRSDLQEVEIKPDTTLVVSFNMRPTFTVVDFSVDPVDAAIYLDGVFIGSGAFQEELERGRHRITISKDGYRPYGEDLNIVQDTLSIHRKLERIETRLELYSTPLGAQVHLNGDSLGMTPINLSLGYGNHAVLLGLDGYREHVLELDITESGSIRELVRMQETPEVIARREYRKQIRGHIAGTLISGALATGVYIGHRVLKNEFEATPDDDDNKQLYDIGRWASLGVSGILAINALSNVYGLISTDYNRILEKQLEIELNQSLSFNMGYSLSSQSVKASLSF